MIIIYIMNSSSVLDGGFALYALFVLVSLVTSSYLFHNCLVMFKDKFTCCAMLVVALGVLTYIVCLSIVNTSQQNLQSKYEQSVRYMVDGTFLLVLGVALTYMISPMLGKVKLPKM